MTRGSLVALVLAVASPAQAAVMFQNTGTAKGWDSQITQHIGTITDVSAPAYRGPTSIRMDQTFQGFDGYHTEVRKHDIGHPGEDLYYSEALQLPSNWIFHDQNVTFQQWAQTDVFGSPWVLMFVQRDHLFVAHVVGGKGTTDLGSIAGLQGTWIRLVTRLKLGPDGIFEFWVNGVKKASLKGDIQAPNKGAVRWSVGMYCTYWRRENPKGLDPMVLFHDHVRVATTYEEADPANWSDGEGTPPPAADAGAADAGTPRSDGGAVPADAAPAAEDARPASDTGGGGGGGGTGGSPAQRRLDAGATGGSAGSEPDPTDPEPPAGKPAKAPSGGCALAAPGPAPPLVILAGLVVALGLGRRRRR